MVEIQSFLLNSDSFCASSPWFVTTLGTLEKSYAFTCYLDQLCVHSRKSNIDPSSQPDFCFLTYNSLSLDFAIRDVRQHNGCSKRHYVTKIDL